jgi:hypothetical protein
LVYNLNYTKHTNINAIIAGRAWVKKMRLEAERVPYRPAMMTQVRKKVAMFFCQVGSVMKKLQVRPAARKPLYRPWFAARPLVGLNRSGARASLNTFLPVVSQANISIHMINRCSSATKPVKTLANIGIMLCIMEMIGW